MGRRFLALIGHYLLAAIKAIGVDMVPAMSLAGTLNRQCGRTERTRDRVDHDVIASLCFFVLPFRLSLTKVFLFIRFDAYLRSYAHLLCVHILR